MRLNSVGIKTPTLFLFIPVDSLPFKKNIWEKKLISLPHGMNS